MYLAKSFMTSTLLLLATPIAKTLAVAIRCFGHVISGVIFYSQNAWDGWGAWGYSLAFNLSSRLPGGILSILIVSVLPLTLMRRAIARREAK